MLILLRFGGVPLMGVQSSPRYQGSLGCLPGRRRGGPWAPPPRDAQNPGDVDGSSCLFFCCGLWTCSLVVCWVLFVSWVGILYGSLALQDSTLVGFIFVCPFSFCSIVCRRRFSRSLSLSLSLSGAGETQTLSWFMFPLVFLRPGRAPRLRPVCPRPHFHQGHHPACFFC